MSKPIEMIQVLRTRRADTFPFLRKRGKAFPEVENPLRDFASNQRPRSGEAKPREEGQRVGEDIEERDQLIFGRPLFLGT